MPKAFDNCQKAGGRIRTVKGPSKRWDLRSGQFRHICWDKSGKPHRGFAKTNKMPDEIKKAAKRAGK